MSRISRDVQYLFSSATELRQELRDLCLNGPPLVVGQAPSVASRSEQAFDGPAGDRMAGVLGFNWRAHFECQNLLDFAPPRRVGEGRRGDEFDLELARPRARAMAVNYGRSRALVLCGREVSRAFGVSDEPVLTWRRTDDLRAFIVVPHPSGVNHFYDSEENKERAQAVIGSLWRLAHFVKMKEERERRRVSNVVSIARRELLASLTASPGTGALAADDGRKVSESVEVEQREFAGRLLSLLDNIVRVSSVERAKILGVLGGTPQALNTAPTHMSDIDNQTEPARGEAVVVR